MRRFMFLGLGGFLLLAAGILLCGAGPARADNGPHVAGANGGGFNKIVGADRCASCHRAHLDEGAAAVGTSLDGLCPTCHGPSALGSTTDVVDGVGYAADVTPGRSQGTGPGALRLGGFSYAHIGSGTATKDTYFQGPTLLARNQDIPVLAASQATTSSHRVAGLPVTVTATGTGATGSVTMPWSC
jgi:predicted CXXCH cytochrome family protein